MAGQAGRPKPSRILRIQAVTICCLWLAGMVNFLDRSSLAIANTTIRAELGLSGTQIGALLSVFSLVYAFSQLPAGILLDRFGTRVVLTAAMFVWSLAQTVTGLASSFSEFVATRVVLAGGEAPFIPSSVKAIQDWFHARDRGAPMGILVSSNNLGPALAPPLLTAIMLRFGWRHMLMGIGALGFLLAFAWYPLYRDRNRVAMTPADLAYLGSPPPGAKFALREWVALFRLRTMWGMMLGFGGVNYTTWLYISWLPGYLQAARHLTLSATGWVAMIPFLGGAAGGLTSGALADWMVRWGLEPMRSRKMLIVGGLICSGLSTIGVPYATGIRSAVVAMSAAVYFIYFAGTSAWGLVEAAAPPRYVASVGSIQNFGSFVCASFGPVLTGWLLDHTHSFQIALIICGCVAFLGALSYLFVVKDPIPASVAAGQELGV